MALVSDLLRFRSYLYRDPTTSLDTPLAADGGGPPPAGAGLKPRHSRNASGRAPRRRWK